MIEEANASFDLDLLLRGSPGAGVEAEDDIDFCFGGLAGEAGLPGGHDVDKSRDAGAGDMFLRSTRLPPPARFCLRPPSRALFNLLRKPSLPKTNPAPLLSQDNLFHPFSKSPFPPVRARGEAIQNLAPCPVCHDHGHTHTKVQSRLVKFECPDCGWPTHCSEDHWKEDVDHQKYCRRLREANEDEHDLRSGRRVREFELPGAHTGFFLVYF